MQNKVVKKEETIDEKTKESIIARIKNSLSKRKKDNENDDDTRIYELGQIGESNKKITLFDRIYDVISDDLEQIIKQYSENYLDLLRSYYPQDKQDEIDFGKKKTKIVYDEAKKYIITFRQRVDEFEKNQLNNAFTILEQQDQVNGHGSMVLETSDGKKTTITFDSKSGDDGELVKTIQVDINQGENDISYSNKITIHGQGVTTELSQYDENGNFITDTEYITFEEKKADRVCEYMRTENGVQVAHGFVSETAGNVHKFGGDSKRATYSVTDVQNNKDEFVEITDYSNERTPECRYEMLFIMKNMLLERAKDSRGTIK